MTMTLRSTLALATCVALIPLMATSALAQSSDLERTLRDGRILSAPTQVEGCEAPMITGNTNASFGMEFVCQAPVDGQAEPAMAGVGTVLLSLAILKTSREFLTELSEDWWPNTTEQERRARIVEKTKMFGEEAVPVECIQRTVEAGPAVIVCVIQSNALQFMTSGRSVDLAAAEKGMDMVLAGFRLRPAEPAPESSEAAPAAPPVAAN